VPSFLPPRSKPCPAPRLLRVPLPLLPVLFLCPVFAAAFLAIARLLSLSLATPSGRRARRRIARGVPATTGGRPGISAEAALLYGELTGKPET
jgi:hypothetical protein